MSVIKIICLLFFAIGLVVSAYGIVSALKGRYYKESTTGHLGLIYGIVGSLLGTGMIIYLILT